ncbi:MAG: alanine--tRNA ligase [Verrucomicrobiota bacterium]|jgi:alanyl-tRNA synthetase
MTSAEIRQSFLDFFQSKGHTLVPSSSLLPEAPNLLFTNAGMNQFVPIFLGQRAPDLSKWADAVPGLDTRAADTQKCIRAGGKHNDLEDVGLDTYHHTFFEMLGNWSFGDYFKKEAIAWAWELLTEVWKFPTSRLYATVYRPDQTKGDPSHFDQEAHDLWAEQFRAAGLDPKIHVVSGGKQDNFWMMGDTGPCGPCSEIHMDLTPLGDTQGRLVNQGAAACIELWNLVFIQFNANPDGSFSPLPARHVDTGMGFERVAGIIQNTANFTDFSRAISNYETDIFRPLFDKLEKLSGKKYGSTLPAQGAARMIEAEKIDVAFRVIADHIRTLSFAIADGIQPSNEGRGYVLRRILRRAVRYGRSLGFHQPFFYKLVDVLAGNMGEVFREIRSQRDHVEEVIQREEEAFNKTLDEGCEIFEGALTAIGGIKAYLHTIPSGLEKSLQQLDDLLESDTPWDDAQGISAGLSDLVRDPALIQKGVDSLTNLPPGSLRSAKPAVLFQLDWREKWRRLWDPIFEIFRELEELLPRRRSRQGELPDGFRSRWERIRNGIYQVKAELPTVEEELNVFPGGVAFKLADTYGFPLDLTELMARERGLTVDVAGFNKLMEEQRARARAARKKEVIELSEVETAAATRFVGYDKLETPAKVLEVVGLKDKTAVILDTSPFYAEMGGQVGDTGELSSGGQLWRIVNTQKAGDAWLHFLEVRSDGLDVPELGSEATLTVDRPRRFAIQRHHTVTHLLHWALHQVVSRDAAQKGSYVGPDKLTFDFASGPLTPRQVAEVERLVNERILENAPVSWVEVKYDHIKNRKDIRQFFGEKYGEWVRAVQIGGEPAGLNGYSMELCGGTHVRATGELGLFRIAAEFAIAAGIRRIEAVAGLEAYQRAHEESQLIRTISGKVNSPVAELEKKIESLLAQQKQLDKQLKTMHQQQAADLARTLAAKAQTLGSTRAIVENLGAADGDFLQAVADGLKARFKGVVVLGAAANNAVALVATVSPELTKQFQAGKILQAIAPLVGGKGGGRPDNARGGGKDVAGLAEALAKAAELIRG